MLTKKNYTSWAADLAFGRNSNEMLTVGNGKLFAKI